MNPESKASLASTLITTLKGMAMGTADVVPGVSGGTVALILGIYERLIGSLSTLSRTDLWKTLFRLELRRFFTILDWQFLLPLLVGIAVAVLSLASGLEWLLATRAVYVWSFFFGLIAASVWTVSRRVRSWTPGVALLFVLGAVVAFGLVGLSPARTPEQAWFLVLSGMLAITALILPGISGAFILVLLGKYEFVLQAVSSFDFATIALLGVGAVIGLLSVVRLIAILLASRYDATLALLCGFMLGSLRKIWPWKAELDDPLNELASNRLPELFIGGNLNPELLAALGLAAGGALLVLILEAGGGRRTER